MNISDTLALGSTLNPTIGDPPDACEELSTARSAERKDSAAGQYASRTAANLRTIVERRFRRMSEAHDRICTKLRGTCHK